jgi:integrase
MGWLPWPVLPKKQWPKVQYGAKRAITWEEHQRIVEREQNPERRSFYELCWLLGGSQGDLASLRAEDIDWGSRVVSYRRQKTKTMALLHFGEEVAALLRQLPTSGPLFPYLRRVRAADRATEFRQRCRGLGITGVTLHSYRYAWAERAKQCGYPEPKRLWAITVRRYIGPTPAKPKSCCLRWRSTRRRPGRRIFSPFRWREARPNGL